MKERFQIIKLARDAPSRPPKGGRRGEHQSIGQFMTPLEVFWESSIGIWTALIVCGVVSYFLIVP